MNPDIPDAEVLGSASAPPQPGPPAELTIVRTRRGLLCRYRLGDSSNDGKAHVLAALTASALEDRFASHLVEVGSEDPAIADHLASLHAVAINRAGEKVRVARATTRREGREWWFDVGIFRWGASDFEIACQYRGAPHRDPRVTAIARVFQGATAGDALAALEVFCDVLALRPSRDEVTRAGLRELRDAGRACVAEAIAAGAHPSVA